MIGRSEVETFSVGFPKFDPRPPRPFLDPESLKIYVHPLAERPAPDALQF